MGGVILCCFILEIGLDDRGDRSLLEQRLGLTAEAGSQVEARSWAEAGSQAVLWPMGQDGCAPAFPSLLQGVTAGGKTSDLKTVLLCPFVDLSTYTVLIGVKQKNFLNLFQLPVGGLIKEYYYWVRSAR